MRRSVPDRDLRIRLLVPAELETERLRLRLWRAEDFAAYAEQYGDPSMARFIGGVAAPEDAWRRMAAVVGHWVLRGHGFWAVEERAGGAFVGSVGLWRPEGWPGLELGYWLVRGVHGRGYATEAARASRDVAFDVLGSEDLISCIHPDNEASKHVAERLGAVPDRLIELLDFGPHWIYRYPKPSG